MNQSKRDMWVNGPRRGSSGQQQSLPAILLAVPAQAWSWTASMKAIYYLQLPANSRAIIGAGRVSDVAAQRNAAIKTFLTDPECRDFKYVLFLDSDMLPAPDLALRLVKVAEGKQLDILGVPAVGRVPPHHVCVDMDGSGPAGFNVPSEGLHEVHRTGFGCALVHRRVLAAMAVPHFEYTDNRPHVGEDWYFCEKARDAGSHVWLDFDLEIGHVGLTSHVLRRGRNDEDETDPGAASLL